MSNYVFYRAQYRAIATALQKSRPNQSVYGPMNADRKQWWLSVEKLIEVFEADNPNFDRERFIMWCLE